MHLFSEFLNLGRIQENCISPSILKFIYSISHRLKFLFIIIGNKSFLFQFALYILQICFDISILKIKIFIVNHSIHPSLSLFFFDDVWLTFFIILSLLDDFPYFSFFFEWNVVICNSLILSQLRAQFLIPIHIRGSYKSICCTRLADSCGSSTSMNICVNIIRNLIMNNILNHRNIKPSCSNISAHQHGNLLGFKLIHLLKTLSLLHLGVQRYWLKT